MKVSPFKRVVFILIVLTAVSCIGVGFFKAWESFNAFDETILREKDSQFYSLMRSDDVNIDNSIDAFLREARSYYSRERLKTLINEWKESEDKDKTRLENYFANNPVSYNPIYADSLLMNKKKVIISESGNKKYTFLTDKNESDLSICTDNDGRYYFAYEYKIDKNIKCEALMDLEQLYTNVMGSKTGTSLWLMDNTSTLLIHKSGDDVIVSSVDDDSDENAYLCAGYMVTCQEENASGGTTLNLIDMDENIYAARMVVIPSSNTVNGLFAIGVTTDYEEAIRPSREAAGKILIFGGVAIAGVVVLVFMLILLRRTNIANTTELENLKKKNEMMQELNQNMLALTHHQRLETIGTMTASIAHDFNNLLTPIMGYSMMSMEMLPDDATEIQENLMEVYNASVKAKDMVTRLADLSKKSKEENFIILDPDEIIRNSLKVTLPAKPKGVEVKGRFRANGRKIRGDTTQVSQMIINIVLNAYDEMSETGGSLFVSTSIEDDRVAMKFRDTGRGMDAETVARIFDPFYTTKESGKGTGLGLAIVAQIVETHGGKMYVDSTPGEGTEFKITFPIAENQLDRSKTIVISSEELKSMLNNPHE